MVTLLALSKKVCLLGDFAVGKTSLVRRFVYNLFDDKDISSIGVKVSRKVITLPHNGELIDLSMMLWDLAGNEAFDSVRQSYLRGSAGAVLVCDLTRLSTLHSIFRYVSDLRSINPQAVCVLAANKADLLDQREISRQQLADTANELGAPYHLTSAKTGDAVEALFRELGCLLMTVGTDRG